MPALAKHHGARNNSDMLTTILAVLACALYLVATGLHLHSTRNQQADTPRLVILSVLALLVHGGFASFTIVTDSGANIGVLPMGALMMWAINGLYLLSFLRRPVTSLSVFLFPLTALSIGFTWWLSDGSRIRDNLGFGLTVHIALSVVAYGLLTLATLQALFVAVADRSLKTGAIGIMRFVPPLQAIDAMMFEQIALGIIFLTLSIGSGLIYFDASVPGLIHHTFISVAAWAVFAVLLVGRQQWGWRGVIASRWTVAGFLLLALAYFGSKIMLEVFLDRS